MVQFCEGTKDAIRMHFGFNVFGFDGDIKEEIWLQTLQLSHALLEECHGFILLSNAVFIMG